MPRRSQPKDPEERRQEVIQLLTNFADELHREDLREKVIALIPAFHALRDLGSSLVPKGEANSGFDRLLLYLRRYPQRIIDGDELMVVSGIGEWARRVRELRKEHGWWIYTGVTFKTIAEEARDAGENESADAIKELLGIEPTKIKKDQYVLMRLDQDKQAAHRWHQLNRIRRKKGGVKAKLLEYFLENVGEQIPGEELQYLAKNKKEWARRTRELRTEDGWQVVTRNSGRSDLAIGVYVLESNIQAEEHDRDIPDDVRVAVLKRDNFSCTWQDCGWNRTMLSPDDPRKFLELHHVTHHKDKGPNSEENLRTLCNVHHDQLHREMRNEKAN